MWYPHRATFRGFSRFERLTGVSRKTAENIHVLRVVTPCILAQMCRHFPETSVYFHQRHGVTSRVRRLLI